MIPLSLGLETPPPQHPINFRIHKLAAADVMLAHTAFVRHAYPLEHTPRGRIVVKVWPIPGTSASIAQLFLRRISRSVHPHPNRSVPIFYAQLRVALC